MTPIQILGNVFGPSSKSHFVSEHHFLFETNAFEHVGLEQSVPTWLTNTYRVQQCFLLPLRLSCKENKTCIVALPLELGQPSLVCRDVTTNLSLPEIHHCSFEQFIDIVCARKILLELFAHRASYLQNYQPEWKLLEIIKQRQKGQKRKKHAKKKETVNVTRTSPKLIAPLSPCWDLKKNAVTTCTSPKYEVNSTTCFHPSQYPSLPPPFAL